MPPSYSLFPDYTKAERWVDAVVHILGLIGGAIAVIWLFEQAGPVITAGRIATAAVYAFGLIGMLSASALYNLTRAGRLKAIFRRLDHAMIYVMIAGTYTPLSLTALRPGLGIPLCAIVWLLAAIGVALKVVRQHPHERLSLTLYLTMGWLVLPLLPSLIAILPAGAIVLIISGGAIYSLGSFIHTRMGWPFHNAVWHGMVICAAGLHVAAIAQVITLPVGP
ncbi:MAG: Hly-III-like protein [Rhodospirillales bacterium]|nr:Hly-III-like protein [Rhodospirillales bacterium]